MPPDDEPIPADLHLHCNTCGYELTGLIERRCPECGEHFDPRATWLENERSGWDYHFQNVRSKSEYAELVYVIVAGLIFLGLACARLTALLALPVIVATELYILWTDVRGMRMRMICATVCVAWGVLMWLRG